MDYSYGLPCGAAKKPKPARKFCSNDSSLRMDSAQNGCHPGTWLGFVVAYLTARWSSVAHGLQSGLCSPLWLCDWLAAHKYTIDSSSDTFRGLAAPHIVQSVTTETLYSTSSMEDTMACNWVEAKYLRYPFVDGSGSTFNLTLSFQIHRRSLNKRMWSS